MVGYPIPDLDDGLIFFFLIKVCYPLFHVQSCTERRIKPYSSFGLSRLLFHGELVALQSYKASAITQSQMYGMIVSPCVIEDASVLCGLALVLSFSSLMNLR